MKKIAGLLLVLCCIASHCKADQFQDISYTFDQQKNQAAQDSFHFLRSYVDYFYLIIDVNKSKFKAFDKLSKTSGECVGDAHPENFGYLIQKDNTSLFTVNDMDDFGPCPVAYDLYRLLVSASLYDKNIKLDKLVSSYSKGLSSDFKSDQEIKSDTLKKMLEESQQKLTQINQKKINSGQFIRGSNIEEVSEIDQKKIVASLKQKNLGLSDNYKVFDMISTSKIGGGSGGLLRYEVLIDNDGQLIHLELKEQVKPSIYPVATDTIPTTFEKIKLALQIEQNFNASSLYSTMTINNIELLIRPRFEGNIGVTLADGTKSDNENIINYEAYTLGKIHSQSVKNIDDYQKDIKNISEKDLEEDVKNMADIFDSRFKTLKN